MNVSGGDHNGPPFLFPRPLWSKHGAPQKGHVGLSFAMNRYLIPICSR